MQVPGKCKSCCHDFIIDVQADICQTCFVNEIRVMTKRKISVWYKLKHFSWFALIVLPTSIFIGVKFGSCYQYAFGAGFVFAPLISILADYLNEKF